MIDVKDKVIAAAPTRVQPVRERKQTTRLIYFVYNARDSPITAASCIHAINVMISRTHACTRACQQCLPDFGGCTPIDVLLKTGTLGGGGDVVPEFTGRIAQCD